jgi:Transposase IS66 family
VWLQKGIREHTPWPKAIDLYALSRGSFRKKARNLIETAQRKSQLNGKLIHADETKISIGGKSAYVWVFTNLEEVAYLYTETREGDFLQKLWLFAII